MKTVIVTGASKGVGEATAKLLSEEYEVIALSRNIDLMNESFKDFENIKPYKIDLQNLDQIEKFKEYIQDKDIRALINNAGGGGGSNNIAIDRVENWQYAYNVNVIAPMLLSQIVIPSMRKNKIFEFKHFLQTKNVEF
jgi:short-subunit dehydrogenase